jgi:hypothetical protein
VGSQRLSLSLCRDPAKGNFLLGVLLGVLGVLAVYFSEKKFSLLARTRGLTILARPAIIFAVNTEASPRIERNEPS